MREVTLYNKKLKETRILTEREDGFTEIELINKKGVGSKSIGFKAIEQMVEYYKGKGYEVDFDTVQ